MGTEWVRANKDYRYDVQCTVCATCISRSWTSFVVFSSMSLCQVQESLGGHVHFGNIEVWNGYVALRLLLIRLA
jgi:hypothetical protein